MMEKTERALKLNNQILHTLDQLSINLSQLSISQNHKTYELLLEMHEVLPYDNQSYRYQEYSLEYQLYLCLGLLMEFKLEINLLDSFQAVEDSMKANLDIQCEHLKILFQHAIEQAKISV